MKYKDVSFRDIYKRFCIFSLSANLKKRLVALPHVQEADCALAYGYIDPENGLMLEFLATGRATRNGASFYEGDAGARCSLSIGNALREDFRVAGRDEACLLSERYAAQLSKLRRYEVSEEIEESRSLEFLDTARDAVYVDDVLLHLTCKGLKPEKCWARIRGLKERYILGELLEEPRQDFGFHAGGLVGFGVKETGDNRVICWCDLTLKEGKKPKLTAEDLDGGQLLLYAIRGCHASFSDANIRRVLEILRDSLVWVPGDVILGDDDQAFFQKLAEEAQGSGDIRSAIGKTFSNKDDIRFEPDILRRDDKYYFPVFSSREEMGEYGEGFSKVQKHFLEAIALAKSNKKRLEGIVVNAFTCRKALYIS